MTDCVDVVVGRASFGSGRVSSFIIGCRSNPYSLTMLYELNLYIYCYVSDTVSKWLLIRFTDIS